MGRLPSCPHHRARVLRRSAEQLAALLPRACSLDVVCLGKGYACWREPLQLGFVSQNLRLLRCGTGSCVRKCEAAACDA